MFLTFKEHHSYPVWIIDTTEISGKGFYLRYFPDQIPKILYDGIVFHPGIVIDLIFHKAALLLLLASQCLYNYLVISSMEAVSQTRIVFFNTQAYP